MKKLFLCTLFLTSTALFGMEPAESPTENLQLVFASLVSINEALTKNIHRSTTTLTSGDLDLTHKYLEVSNQLVQDFIAQSQKAWTRHGQLSRTLEYTNDLSTSQALIQQLAQLTEDIQSLENNLVEHMEKLEQLKAQFAQKSNKVDCQSCLLEAFEGQTQKLACGHLYCKECLKRLTEIAFKDKNILTTLVCKIDGCNTSFAQQDIEKALPNKQQLLALNELATYQAIASLPGGKHCPRAGCSYAYIDEGDAAHPVTCPKCTHTYCSKCHKRPHAARVRCEDAEFEEWRQSANTRNCPQCKVTIEKESGCNIMTCSKCQHKFCWICQKPRGYGKHSCPLYS